MHPTPTSSNVHIMLFATGDRYKLERLCRAALFPLSIIGIAGKIRVKSKSVEFSRENDNAELP